MNAIPKKGQGVTLGSQPHMDELISTHAPSNNFLTGQNNGFQKVGKKIFGGYDLTDAKTSLFKHAMRIAKKHRGDKNFTSTFANFAVQLRDWGFNKLTFGLYNHESAMDLHVSYGSARSAFKDAKIPILDSAINQAVDLLVDKFISSYEDLEKGGTLTLPPHFDQLPDTDAPDTDAPDTDAVDTEADSEVRTISGFPNPALIQNKLMAYVQREKRHEANDYIAFRNAATKLATDMVQQFVFQHKADIHHMLNVPIPEAMNKGDAVGEPADENRASFIAHVIAEKSYNSPQSILNRPVRQAFWRPVSTLVSFAFAAPALVSWGLIGFISYLTSTLFGGARVSSEANADDASEVTYYDMDDLDAPDDAPGDGGTQFDPSEAKTVKLRNPGQDVADVDLSDEEHDENLNLSSSQDTRNQDTRNGVKEETPQAQTGATASQPVSTDQNTNTAAQKYFVETVSEDEAQEDEDLAKRDTENKSRTRDFSGEGTPEVQTEAASQNQPAEAQTNHDDAENAAHVGNTVSYGSEEEYKSASSLTDTSQEATPEAEQETANVNPNTQNAASVAEEVAEDQAVPEVPSQSEKTSETNTASTTRNVESPKDDISSTRRYEAFAYASEDGMLNAYLMNNVFTRREFPQVSQVSSETSSGNPRASSPQASEGNISNSESDSTNPQQGANVREQVDADVPTPKTEEQKPEPQVQEENDSLWERGKSKPYNNNEPYPNKKPYIHDHETVKGQVDDADEIPVANYGVDSQFDDVGEDVSTDEINNSRVNNSSNVNIAENMYNRGLAEAHDADETLVVEGQSDDADENRI